MLRSVSRALLPVAGGAAAVLVLAAPAFAHVSVSPSSAPAGSETELTFRVPTEVDTASTVKLQVVFPADAPIPSVAVRPVPGWTVSTTKTKLAAPVQTDDGEVTEAVSQVIWTAAPGAGIGPDQYQDFAVSAGPIPDVSALTFKAVQTYSDGQVVRWIEQSAPGTAEPDHPAPMVTVTAGTSVPPAPATTPASASAQTAAPSSATGSSAALPVAVAGLVVAVAALAVGGVAVARARRR